MSSAVLPPSVSPPAPFKNRRGWIIAFGIFEILIGCLVLMGIALAVIGIRMTPANPSVQQPDARLLAMGAAFYGLIALGFVGVGIGNVQVKRWARLGMLIVSWAWLVIGILVTALMAVVLPMIMEGARQSSTQALPANFETIFRVFMFIVLGISFIVLPLVFVLFYSGKNVKATYENAPGAMAAGPRKPLSVWIATVWFAFSAFGYVFVFATPVLPLFGVLFRGWQAAAVAAVLELLAIWLTLNVYRQRAVAWKVAIPMVAFGWVSLLVTLRRMGVAGMYQSMGYNDAQIAQMVPLMRYFLGFSAVLAVAFLVMLMATRKHYHDSPAGFPG